MKLYGRSHGNPSLGIVRWNLEQYVDTYNSGMGSAQSLAEAFVDMVAESGYVDSARELLELMPSEVIELVKSHLASLRDAGFKKLLTPGIGCQLTEQELTEYENELRPRYIALDADINKTQE
jgi:hypothetical protein